MIMLLALLAAAQEDRESVRKTHEAVRKSFVTIEATLRKKTRLEKAEHEEEAPDDEVQQLHALSENRQTFDGWGVAVEKDLILMADRSLRATDVEKIELTDPSGARVPGTIHAVGRNHDFVLLKAGRALEVVPLTFGEWQAPAMGESFHVTYADRVDNRWHLNVSPYIQTNSPLVEGPGWFCTDVMRPGSVVSDRAGAPVGVALDQYLWVRPDGSSSFLGKALLADERVADLDRKYETLRKGVGSSVLRVEISFRVEKGDEYALRADPKSLSLALFGAPLDESGTILIPQELPRELIRKIDDIRVLSGGTAHPAKFVGAFKGFGAMIVRAEGLKRPSPLALDAVAPAPGKLFFTATFEDRFGRSRIKVDYNRVFRTDKGLGGAARLQPRRRVKEGSWLLDFEGRVAGFATTDSKEEDLDEMALQASRERYYAERYRPRYGNEFLRRLVFFSEIGGLLKNPAAHFDAKAVPMSTTEEKRLVWVGLEYQELSKPIAEALAIQERELTNDGRRGLLVTDIYPDSPAARAGLKPDDILLSVQPEGGAPARDLVGEPERPGGYYGGFPGRGGRTASPWRPRRNFLTSMLTEIGEGRTVTLSYLRAKEKKSLILKLEKAPTDYETAERHKDDALGFTVKELTYEVRYFHKLEAGATGVVVARVESGGKADVAKLPALSIVSRLNDVPIKDLGHFRELLGRPGSVTLTSLAYGQTKLVELTRE